MSNALKSIFQAGSLLILYGFGALNATFFSHYCQGEFKELSVFVAKKCCEESDKVPCNNVDQLKKVPCCSFQIASANHDCHESQKTPFYSQWQVNDFVLPELWVLPRNHESKYQPIAQPEPSPPARDIDFFSTYQVYRI